MKIVVAVDQVAETRQAGDLVGALKFRSPTVTLLHVIERLGAPGWETLPVDESDLIDRFLKNQEVEGRKLVQTAASDMMRFYSNPKSELLTGFSAAKQIMAYSEQTEADLIAIGSHAKGRLEGLMVGSVGRKLAIGARQSVLVAKQAVLGDAITAVFATDHSEYANRCLETLVKFMPAGISRLVVLTAFPKTLIGAMRNVMENFSVNISAWVEEKLHEHNQKAIDHLRPLGCEFESRVTGDSVDVAIRETMQEFDAQLLIVGAHGHGFFERMMLGSVALNQVVAEPHSVLILRAQ